MIKKPSVSNTQNAYRRFFFDHRKLSVLHVISKLQLPMLTAHLVVVSKKNIGYIEQERREEGLDNQIAQKYL